MPRWLTAALVVVILVLGGYVLYDLMRPDRGTVFELETPEGDVRLEVPEGDG